MRCTPRKELCHKHTYAVSVGRLVNFQSSVNFCLQVRRTLYRRDRRGVSLPRFRLLDHVEACGVR